MDAKYTPPAFLWLVGCSVFSALGLFLGPIPLGVFSFGVFLKPLALEFQAGRGSISFARALHSTILAFGLPLAGRLIDRFGARKVILPFTFISALIMLSSSFCSTRIWQLYLFYLVLGVASCGVSPVSYCYLISHWFDRFRGLALGVMMLGLGLGAIIMPPVAQYLIAAIGWRFTFGLVGAAILLFTMPVIAILIKDTPDELGLSQDGGPGAAVASLAPHAHPGLSWREAGRAPTFWLLFSAFILVSASVQACFAHIAAILADRGVSAQAGALATSIFGAGLLAGRTGLGYLLDRFFAPRVAAVIFGCAAAGIAILRISASPRLAFVAPFFIGLGLGAEVDIMAYLTSRYFGLRSFGTIYGFTFAGFGLAGGLGTYLMGVAYDATGSYALTLALVSIATFMGAILMLRLGPTDTRPGCMASPGNSRCSRLNHKFIKTKAGGTHDYVGPSKACAWRDGRQRRLQ